MFDYPLDRLLPCLSPIVASVVGVGKGRCDQFVSMSFEPFPCLALNECLVDDSDPARWPVQNVIYGVASVGAEFFDDFNERDSDSRA